MTKNIIIVGSGAVAAELTSYIEDQNKNSKGDYFEILGYLDEMENVPRYWAKYRLKKPVISDIANYKVQDDDHFIIGISSISFRQKMIDILIKKGGHIIGFAHYTSIIADTATIGSGNIIYPYCIIGPNAILRDNNMLTSYSFVSHDCAIGNNNFFATSGISGRVRIGDQNFFGIRSTVLPDISIGDRNSIQAGMVVDRNVGNECTIFHRFREKIIAVNNNKQ
ncbi:MAG: hypothetical protein ABI091_03880 [Ferruginibacter sp.]